jgi:hypothetical protein
MVKPIPLGKTSISSWLNLYLLAKALSFLGYFLSFKKTFIYFLFNLKITFSTKYFNKTFGYPTDLTILLT